MSKGKPNLLSRHKRQKASASPQDYYTRAAKMVITIPRDRVWAVIIETYSDYMIRY